MLLELKQKDLINMIKGTSPYYDLINEWTLQNYGYYNGSHDDWHWNISELKKLNEEDLFTIYEQTVASWE